MKYIKPIILSTTLLPLFSYGLTSSSQDVLAKESGVGGYVGIMAGYNSTNNQMNTDNKNKDYDGKNTPASRFSNGLLFPYFAVNYTFSGLKDQVFLRNYSVDNFLYAQNAMAELGYTHLFENKTKATFSIIGLDLPQDTWQNPYQAGRRDKTKAKTLGVRANFENIYNTGLGLDVAYGKRNVKNDESPNLDAMARSSKAYYGSLSYLMPLSEGLAWRNAVTYEKNSADGDAMSFNGYGYKTSLLMKVWGGDLSTNLSYEKRSFDGKIEVNNLPNVKRKDNRYKVGINYAEKGLFGYESLLGTVIVSYEKQDSNVDFYSYSQPSIMLGAAYTF
ncbi:hypothetical protein CF386_08490 [Paraphotobacterium marinum]|uniref:DUF2860 domain-containing protein n=1 Tax=Paraphotobacterium marinum TaxID=1755811 RepID=A0A220VFB3_9GAMM|nr:DUF2860 family protein [Paraphotobacterium marinum]ASK79098.1 hypothetical protein CF386_08490 [Paraphotobacterium marinum]